MTGRACILAAVVLASCGSERAPASPALTAATTPWVPYSCNGGVDGLSAACLALAAEYVDAMAYGVACAEGDTCEALRPVGSRVDGLCSCPVLVNASRTTAVDAALARFLDAGCTIACCPCPSSAPAPHACPPPGSLHAGSCG